MYARNATLPDAFAIEQLIQVHVGDGTLLPRSLAEICENIRDFIVVENEGEIVGCGALHLYGMHLAEVRSITVDQAGQGQGRRTRADRCADERGGAAERDLRLPVHAHSGVLRQDGLPEVEKEELPDKMLKDCLKCPRQNACDEIAMYIGTLPKSQRGRAVRGRRGLRACIGAARVRVLASEPKNRARMRHPM